MKYKIIAAVALFGFLSFLQKDNISSEYLKFNQANVSSSVYKEPTTDLMGKIKVTTSEPKVAKDKKVALSYGPVWVARWVSYVNETFHGIVSNESYENGTSITFWLTDYDNITQNGFFLGWFGPLGTVIPGGFIADKLTFTLLGHTEVYTKFNSCAELYPRDVYFSSVNELEKKIVQFANNKGDSGMGIKADGEIAALAVVYSNGGVCARFTEGCTGKVVCNTDEYWNFFNAYQGKTLKSIIWYHTHDDNTNQVHFGPIYNQDGNEIHPKLTTPPSFDDLEFDLYLRKYYAPDIIDKVISSTGAGYTYNVPKSSKLYGKNQKKLDAMEKKFYGDYPISPVEIDGKYVNTITSLDNSFFDQSAAFTKLGVKITRFFID